MKPAYPIDTAPIREALQNILSPVTLHYYTPDIDSWYSHAERMLLENIESSSDYITLHIHAGQWDAEREAQVGIARTPAIALYGKYEQDTGIRYYGAPDGYKLIPFLNTICAAAAGAPPLSPGTMERIHSLDQPIHLEVLVSPT